MALRQAAAVIRPRARRFFALLLCLCLAYAFAADTAVAAKKKKKDRKPATTRILTEDGAVLVGSPVPVEALAELTHIRGVSSDAGSGVGQVVVIMKREVNGVVIGVVAFEGWLLGCRKGRKTCRWQVPVHAPRPEDVLFGSPAIELLLATPGEWQVEALAFDRAGNRPKRVARISVLVL